MDSSPPLFLYGGPGVEEFSPAGGVSLRPIPRKALFYRRGAQTLRLEKPPPAVRVCASLPGKPYSSVEGRKPFAGKSRRRR